MSEGGFIYYALMTFEGKGITEFCKENGIPIKTAKNDLSVVQKDDFDLKVKARNLAIASKILNKKPSKTILLKLYNPYQVKNFEGIVSLANLMLDYIKG